MIIPNLFRTTLRRSWGFLTFKYSFCAFLCFLAFAAQMAFRVPGDLLFIILPLISLALTVVYLFSLMVHLFRIFSMDDSSLRMILRGVEKTADWVILFFVLYSAYIFANGYLSLATLTDRPSEILEITNSEVDIGPIISVSWAKIRSWENPEKAVRIPLWGIEQDRLWVKEDVLLKVGEGVFGHPWVLWIDKDQEKQYQKVLEIAPTAAEAWQGLVNLYIDRQQWKEASLVAQKYFSLYPNDLEFAKSTAAGFGRSYKDAYIIPIFEPFLERYQDYELYIMTGWAYHRLGKQDRAIELLQASIPLNPDSWAAYYHLGYVYSRTGRRQEAIEMFEKVLERRPNYPEIEEQIASLKKTSAAEQSVQSKIK